ncbi:MAG TPA: GNAT family N-acetyltransferase [Chitinophagaceae bacterium]
MLKSVESLNSLNLTFRTATDKDLPALAYLRASSQDQIRFWLERISLYLSGTHNPQKSLPQRVIYIAESKGKIIGFIAGQLTTRYECQGELQWLDVMPDYQRKKVGSTLVKILAAWFIQNEAYKVCVDPGNDVARLFYLANDARNLNEHWMYWENIQKVVDK